MPGYRQLLLTTALVISAFTAMVVVVGRPATTGTDSKLLSGDPVIAAAVQATVSAPLSTSGDQGDGVKVHGHWTIQVLNADGSLAVREEFENALSADGANAIARLLGRGASAGWWGVELAAAPSATTGPCGVSNGTPVPCWIFEPAITNVAPGASSTNLVVTEPGSGGAPSLTMSGSVGTSAATASQIDIVGTHLMRCSPSTAPSAPCGAPGIAGTLRFTSHTLATPIPLQPGQFVQVTVVISFS